MLGYVNLKLYEAFICYLYAIIGSICCSICTCSSVFQGGHLGHHGYHWYLYIYTTDITYLEFGSMAIPGTNLLEVPIIYNAYVSKGIYHQNMALHGTVPPFRILEFPLIVRRSFQSAGGGWNWPHRIGMGSISICLSTRELLDYSARLTRKT